MRMGLGFRIVRIKLDDATKYETIVKNRMATKAVNRLLKCTVKYVNFLLHIELK